LRKEEEEKEAAVRAHTFANPANTRFALRVTRAGMSCCILYTALDWAGIHTALIICCIIALEDVEATLYRGLLRIVGCLIGGFLGFLSIMYLVPHMETIASLSKVSSSIMRSS